MEHRFVLAETGQKNYNLLLAKTIEKIPTPWQLERKLPNAGKNVD